MYTVQFLSNTSGRGWKDLPIRKEKQWHPHFDTFEAALAMVDNFHWQEFNDDLEFRILDNGECVWYSKL